MYIFHCFSALILSAALFLGRLTPLSAALFVGGSFVMDRRRSLWCGIPCSAARATLENQRLDGPATSQIFFFTSLIYFSQLSIVGWQTSFGDNKPPKYSALFHFHRRRHTKLSIVLHFTVVIINLNITDQLLCANILFSATQRKWGLFY